MSSKGGLEKYTVLEFTYPCFTFSYPVLFCNQMFFFQNTAATRVAVRAALPERAAAGPVLHGGGPGDHRPAHGRRRAPVHGRGCRRFRRIPALPPATVQQRRRFGLLLRSGRSSVSAPRF